MATTDDQTPSAEPPPEDAPPLPAVLLTCAAGIRSPGLAALVDALAGAGSCRLFVCASDSDKSNFGHAISLHDTVSATSMEMPGAEAYEISGTPVDAVSLVLSGALPSWPRPDLVISGINSGSICGRAILHSAAAASAREAHIRGVPSILISANWKSEESKGNDYKEAADACKQLILPIIRDAKKNAFLSGCVLNIGLPSSPSVNKGLKLTRQSVYKSAQTWKLLSTSRPSTAGSHVLSKHYNLGIQLAQLGRDASAAGAARRAASHRKDVEFESVSEAGKQDDHEVVQKFFRAELSPLKHEDFAEDDELGALEDGFISVTPVQYQQPEDSQIFSLASEWLSSSLEDQEADATL